MNVLVLEDLPYTAEWINTRVKNVFPGSEVLTCQTILEARQLIDTTEFDLVLLDISLPDGNSLPLVKCYKQNVPNGIAVSVTIYDDESHIFDAICAGVDGYLIKSMSDLGFERKLDAISHGEPPMSPLVARKILRFTRQQLHGRNGAGIDVDLTDREREVLTLMSKGLSRIEIARLLNLSQHTIAKYIKSIYRKLGISSRAEATLAACSMGLVSLEQAP